MIVVDDPQSELANPEEAEAYFRALVEHPGFTFKVALVRRGGLIAERMMGEFVTVRHERMGRGR